MTDRREFLQAGLAASIMGGAAMQSTAAEGLWPGRGQALRLRQVLVDSSLPESRHFGLQAAQLGLPVHAVPNGDFSDFWYHELDPLWRRQRAPLAGVSRHGPLFVLERLAWDRGMRVAFRGEHSAAGSGQWQHRLTGETEAVAAASARIRSGSGWADAMASVLLQGAALGRQTAVEFSAGAHERSAPETLYSWVIA